MKSKVATMAVKGDKSSAASRAIPMTILKGTNSLSSNDAQAVVPLEEVDPDDRNHQTLAGIVGRRRKKKGKERGDSPGAKSDDLNSKRKRSDGHDIAPFKIRKNDFKN